MISRHLLSGVAALCVFILLAFVVRDAQGAALVGSGADWARSVQMRVPGPAGPEIKVNIGACPGLAEAGGCWMPWSSEIWIFGRNSDVYAHELGHAFDSRNLDDYERGYLLALLGYEPGTAWDPPERGHGNAYCKTTACPLERFASVYAGCALGYVLLRSDGHGTRLKRGERNDPWWGAQGWRVTTQHYLKTCRAIRAFGDPA